MKWSERRRLTELIHCTLSAAFQISAIDAAAVSEALLCEEVAATRVRCRPPRPRRGVYELATEAHLESIGMFALGKAEDCHIDIVLT